MQKGKAAANDEHRDMIRHIRAGNAAGAREVAQQQRARVRGLIEEFRKCGVKI